MPALTRINARDNSPKYSDLAKFYDSKGDKNYCSAIALSLVTGADPEEVWKVLSDLGRVKRRGVPNNMILAALRKLGFFCAEVNPKSIIDTFPKPHCTALKNLTTHHPRRFPGSFDPGKKYLAFVPGHVLAIMDGKVHDHSVNNSFRIYSLLEVHEH